MEQVLLDLTKTPIPGTLVVAGLAFLFAAIVGTLPSISVPKERQVLAGFVGLILLIGGVALYLIPSRLGNRETGLGIPTGRNDSNAATITPQQQTSSVSHEPTEMPTSIPLSDVLYENNFENTSNLVLNGGWTIINDDPSNKVLQGKVGSDYIYQIFGSEKWANYAVQVRIKYTKVGDCGVTVRANSEGEYDLGLGGKLIYRQDYKKTSPVTYVNTPLNVFTTSIAMNEWIDVRVDVVDDLIRGTLNNYTLWSYDGSFKEGKVSLGVGNGGVCLFDDLRISAIR